MPDRNERPGPDGAPPTPPAEPVRRQPPVPDGREGLASEPSGGGTSDPRTELQRTLPATRLPSELRDQILAALPPPEEQERLLRELQQNGGLSSEQFLASLGLTAPRQP